MAEQAPVSADVTPDQFFEQLLPMGFQAQREAGGAVPGDITMQYNLTGPGGGEWAVTIKDGQMSTVKGKHDAPVMTFTLPSATGATPCSDRTARRSRCCCRRIVPAVPTTAAA